MTGIALASNSAAFEQRLRRAFAGALNGELYRWKGNVVGADTHTLVIDLTGRGADVVALGPDVPWDAALKVAKEIDETRPEVSVIIVTEPSPDKWESALRAGVRDVVPSGATDQELREALERAVQTSDRRRRNLASVDGSERAAGRVITVVAPKGGSGKTAVATNLGVGLAQFAHQRVALVDLDLQFGDITPTLQLVPEHTLHDVSVSNGRLDATMLKIFLTKRSENLYVLAAPDSPADGEEVTEKSISKAIELLSWEFDYVIVDTSAGLTEHTLAALELSTDVLLVCDLSLAAVRGMRKVIAAFDALGMARMQRHIILNRADSRVGLELSEVAATLGQPVDIKLPSSRAVPLSMNEGTPLLEMAPKSSYSRRIVELVGRLTEHDVRRGRGLFRRVPG